MKILDVTHIKRNFDCLLEFTTNKIKKQLKYLKKCHGYKKETYKDHIIQYKLFKDKVNEVKEILNFQSLINISD